MKWAKEAFRGEQINC